MINEYIGIKRNLVDLSAVPNIDPELKQVVLSPKQDKFFQETMYMNFGDLADKVKNYVDQYKAKANITKQINTIEDIKAFIEKYPEFKKLSGNISKHMAIVSELDRQLQVKNIWEVSELEQNLATHDDNNHDFNELKRLLGLTTVESYFKLKLCCIFVLRHGSNGGRVKEIENILRQQCDPAQVALYFQFKNRFKSSFKVRADPQDNDLISGLTKKFNKLGSSGAENVFMQHVPELTRILSDLDKNKFPQSGIKLLNERIDTKTYIPQDVVIFIVGGLTIEESRAVHQFNEKYRKGKDNCRIIIGGTSILTTEQFLTDVSAINDKPEDLL